MAGMEDDKYQWDEAKRAETIRDRQLDFALASSFLWESSVTEPSNRRGERRYRAIGYFEDNPRLHTIVFTWRGSARRIISMRPASRREREYHARVQRRRSSNG